MCLAKFQRIGQQQQRGIVFTGVVYAISTAELMKIIHMSVAHLSTDTAKTDSAFSPYHDYVSLHFQHPAPFGPCASRIQKRALCFLAAVTLWRSNDCQQLAFARVRRSQPMSDPPALLARCAPAAGSHQSRSPGSDGASSARRIESASPSTPATASCWTSQDPLRRVRPRTGNPALSAMRALSGLGRHGLRETPPRSHLRAAAGRNPGAIWISGEALEPGHSAGLPPGCRVCRRSPDPDFSLPAPGCPPRPHAAPCRPAPRRHRCRRGTAPSWIASGS